MVVCSRIIIIVTILVSFLGFNVFAFDGQAEIVGHDLKIKVLKKELWEKGVIEDNQVNENNIKKDNTIYFPEELEIALKLISA